ncbi:Bug family tripartite tricarboxylate transporter substrate binding protein [Enterovirga rhinocerotis]|uniref:Tripartite-type tricarboxylate transporter receptor subunit TctC n=1 Tax=Enterovirga rhinocerotis TaxID=1339210 RepID=A0A4R7C9A8_9HYPH|nr:tripartite tricarboxylate transporter substrate binding protein [Enterovirga rhinocerotis]TDR94991.1 tripartite-type tricarboxylate transporter receptor subunit TctC [Enterovirga rhinocerotis]
MQDASGNIIAAQPGLDRRAALLGLGGLAASTVAGRAQAAFPSRILTLIVPFAAGGSTDILARLLADAVGKELGQQVIVENVPGAGGGIAGRRVLAAQADGHTLLIGNTGTLAAAIAFYRNKPYDPPADFTALASVADSPQMLVANKNTVLSGLDAFEAYARENEGKLNFGAAGIGSGSYLGAVILNRRLGLNIQIVNYRSSGGSLNDLLAGNVSFIVESPTGSLQHIQGGVVTGVAVLQKSRMAGAPKMPAASESRFSDLDYRIWNMVVVKKGTPDPIVRRLADAVAKATRDPLFAKRTVELGLDRPEESQIAPEGAQRLLAEEGRRWQPIVESLNVSVD